MGKGLQATIRKNQIDGRQGPRGLGSQVKVVFFSLFCFGVLMILLDSNYFEIATEESRNDTSRTGSRTMSGTELTLGDNWTTEDEESIDSDSETLVWNDDVHQSIRNKSIIVLPTTPIHVEEEVGHIVSTDEHDRLVVNVNEKYLYWRGGQDRLCQLLRNMTLSSSLDGTQGVPIALLNVTMDCYDHVTNKQGLGQGNWVTAIYAARMATALAGVDFKFQCSDGQKHKMQFILPWFDQYKPAPADRTSWPFSGSRPTQSLACSSKYGFLRIDLMASEIQGDIRNMAVALVGDQAIVPRYPHYASKVAPLIPNVVLDNVAIHFRCGDVLGGAKRNDFGMIRFYEYKKWIPRNTTSIGILTQPFEKKGNRGMDARKAENCRSVVEALVDYLQKFAPNAKISIHNGINETLTLAYARLAMANYSFTSLSSFGIFPVVGTFGDGYFQKGNRGVNPFATHIPQYLSNIHQMNAEVRGTWDMWGKPVEDLIAWFVDESNAPTDVLEGIMPFSDMDPLDQSGADHKMSNASN
jgi:hypothetical protein